MVLETNLYYALIVIGALLILYEAINPGFFAAVPGNNDDCSWNHVYDGH